MPGPIRTALKGDRHREWGRDENQETFLQRLTQSLLYMLLEAVSGAILDQGEGHE